jgi:predicted acetyltransferase
VGYEKDGRVLGYLVFTWELSDHFIVHDLHVKELMAESQKALLELMTFLNAQADQVRFVIINTQDEHFAHLLTDPRNDSGRFIPDVYHETNTQGVGLMYRVIDVPGLLERLQPHDFGGQTCTVRLIINDSFLPENAGSTVLRFERGQGRRVDNAPPDVEVGLDIADFTSLLVGTINLSSLLRYGLAHISDPAYIPTLDRIFHVYEKPICTTPF